MSWGGTTYIGEKVAQPAPLAGALGGAGVPACGDTVPGSPSPEGSADAVAVDGVRSEEAIAVAGDPLHIYIAPGYFPQTSSTRLHDLLYGSSTDLPDERGNDCTNAATAHVRARIRTADFGLLAVELLDSPNLPSENWIFPDAQTVIDSASAQPHVSPGDTIGADVLVCRHPDDPHFLKLVATRLQTP